MYGRTLDIDLYLMDTDSMSVMEDLLSTYDKKIPDILPQCNKSCLSEMAVKDVDPFINGNATHQIRANATCDWTSSW